MELGNKHFDTRSTNKGEKKIVNVTKLHSMKGCFYDPINEKLYQEIDMNTDQE